MIAIHDPILAPHSASNIEQQVKTHNTNDRTCRYSKVSPGVHAVRKYVSKLEDITGAVPNRNS